MCLWVEIRDKVKLGDWGLGGNGSLASVMQHCADVKIRAFRSPDVFKSGFNGVIGAELKSMMGAQVDVNISICK